MQSADSRSATYAGLAADDIGRSDDRPPLVLLHGLTFDRKMWRPALAELETIDPGRRAIALDLPGHGDSPDAPSYMLDELVERVHAAVEDAGLEAPVVVGHSAAAGTAFLYGVMHPSRGVVAVEGTLRVGPFAGMAKSLEPALRGPGFHEVFGRILANAFQLDQVTPRVRAFVEATSNPRKEIVLGYWQALFEFSPDELDAMVAHGASAIRASGLPFASVLGADPSLDDRAWIGANVPDMRIEVWPQSGHFPHLAHPRRFAELLAETGTWGGSVGLVAARSE
ncbi:MAG TPA: alpha/beta hydrolase [Candidatus Limnocylindrales bacterium]|jgi:pimeloyl-ACP methyl ester carboxylesterase